MIRATATRRALLVMPALLASARAGAQGAYPDRPVRLIVPLAAGGAVDVVARALQPRMTERLGQPLVVDNRTGAGGTLGAGMVAAAPPDGHTLLLDTTSQGTAPLVFPNLPFDYATFVPVGQATAQSMVLVVSRANPAQDLAGFVAQNRGRREPVTYGSPGPGTTGHLSGEMFRLHTGVAMEHVAYRGGSDAARDLAAGTLEAAFLTISSAAPLTQNGAARILGVMAPEPSPMLPGVPSIAQSGWPGCIFQGWMGVFAPASTPDPVIRRVNAALVAAVQDPAARDRILASGAEPVSSTPEGFAATVRSTRETLGRMVRETGMRLG